MGLHKRLATTLGGKMIPARRVESENSSLVVAYMDVGEEREQKRKLCSPLIWAHH